MRTRSDLSDMTSSNQSYGLQFSTWGGTNPPKLESATHYLLSVRIQSFQNAISSTQKVVTTSSAPVPFLTRLSETQYASVHPMWSSNVSAQFVLFRRELSTVSHTSVYLAVSAKPQPDRKLPHGRNTSHLLCAYKLWVNGIPLGVGPGRIVNDRIAIDTYNITALVEDTMEPTAGKDSVIAIEAYYKRSSDDVQQSSDVEVDQGGVVAILFTGNGTVGTEHTSQTQIVASHGAMVHPQHRLSKLQNAKTNSAPPWMVFDATSAFGPSTSPQGFGVGTRVYVQPQENIDSQCYPHNWRTVGPAAPVDAGCAVTTWEPAQPRAFFAAGLAAKGALPVSLRTIRPTAFTTLSSEAEGVKGSTYRYVIDYGRNFQGHVNITLCSGTAGQEVTVRLGEQLLTNGSVKFHAESGNTWTSTWTLGGSGVSLRGCMLMCVMVYMLMCVLMCRCVRVRVCGCSVSMCACVFMGVCHVCMGLVDACPGKASLV
eukprot:m.973257 g.973257  ORF g.973257 m.973257 type:complete len:483 (+) comp23933_c0_seq13:401-1849(+)